MVTNHQVTSILIMYKTSGFMQPSRIPDIRSQFRLIDRRNFITRRFRSAQIGEAKRGYL